MCHILAKNDQFLLDQGKVFQARIDMCIENGHSVLVENLTKKDLFGKKVCHKAIFLPEIKLKNGTFSVKYFESKER